MLLYRPERRLHKPPRRADLAILVNELAGTVNVVLLKSEPSQERREKIKILPDLCGVRDESVEPPPPGRSLEA